MVWKRSNVDDPDELEFGRLIERRLQHGRLVRAQYEIVSNRGIGSGSDLAEDDAATAWMHLSHVAVNTLNMAADNIRAIEGILKPRGTLEVPMYAHYPVVRSVLEASALAKWLLLPDDRRERVVRLLRTRFSDVVQDSVLARVGLEAVENMDHSPSPAVLQQQRDINQDRRDRHTTKLREIAGSKGISWSSVKAGLPRWSDLVREVCVIPGGVDQVRVPGQYAEGIWKVMSGLSVPQSHGAQLRRAAAERIGGWCLQRSAHCLLPLDA